MKVKTGVVVSNANVEEMVEVVMDSPIVSKKGLIGNLALIGSGLLLMAVGGICDEDIEPGSSWGL